MIKTLIIAPHWDDEVLGCASFLGKDAHVVYMTTNHPSFPYDEPQREMNILADKVGFTFDQVFGFKSIHVDTYAMKDLIAAISIRVNMLQPEMVLIPSPSYQQDHKAIYEAACNVMRPHDRNWFVKKVLIYEEPDVWGTLRKVDPFKPAYFRSLDVDRKIELYKVYESQVRSYRGFDLLRHLAAMRGFQAGLPNAEAFEVVRWVE